MRQLPPPAVRNDALYYRDFAMTLITRTLPALLAVTTTLVATNAIAATPFNQKDLIRETALEAPLEDEVDQLKIDKKLIKKFLFGKKLTDRHGHDHHHDYKHHRHERNKYYYD